MQTSRNETGSLTKALAEADARREELAREGGSELHRLQARPVQEERCIVKHSEALRQAQLEEQKALVVDWQARFSERGPFFLREIDP